MPIDWFICPFMDVGWVRVSTARMAFGDGKVFCICRFVQFTDKKVQQDTTTQLVTIIICRHYRY